MPHVDLSKEILFYAMLLLQSYKLSLYSRYTRLYTYKWHSSDCIFAVRVCKINI